MSHWRTRRSLRALLGGAVSGAIAFCFGYVFTYAVAGTALTSGGASPPLDALSRGVPTWTIVGWVFYAAHLVPSTVPIAGDTDTVSVNLVAGRLIPAALFLVPPFLLGCAGIGTAGIARVRTTAAGTRAGALVTFGYLPLAVVGVSLFRVHLGATIVGVDPLASLLVLGLLYPIVFGALGGASLGSIRVRGPPSRPSG